MLASVKKILIAGKVHKDSLSLLDERKDISYEMIDFPSEQDFIEKLPDCDALLLRTMQLPKEALRNSKKLRVISRHGVGYDNVPLDVANDMGIPVTIIENVNAVAVAEHTLAMMLTLAKQSIQYDQGVRAENWAIQNTLAATELWHKNALLIGFGRIGFEVSKRLKAFGVKVFVYDPYLTDEMFEKYDVVKVEKLTNALQNADYVSLHLPLTAETQNIIDAVTLGFMKPSAFIVNTARGGLIDEDALFDALVERRIKGAGLDTLAQEPISKHSKLISLDNLLLSPHSACLTNECAIRMGDSAVKNILDAFDGTAQQQLIVNRDSISLCG
jgi:D-3-phosphoglycerate dehydrogenase